MKLWRLETLLTACLGALLGGSALPQAGLAQPPQGERVELVAKDGVRTAAFWYDCGTEGAPVALLLHDNGRDHFAWAPLVDVLRRAGLHVLAPDLRGHGASAALAPGKRDEVVNREATVYREMLLDVQAAHAYLQREHKTPPDRVAVVGAEMGAVLGLALMRENPKLRCMIALSPVLHGYGFETLQLVKGFGKRPLLVFTTKSQYAEATQAVTDAVRTTAAVQVVLNRGNEARGTLMLGQSINVERAIRNFLSAAFGLDG